MSKHLPAPWTVGRDGFRPANSRSSYTLIQATSSTVALVVEGNGRAAPNAHLIAAAPDLLAALQQIATYDPTKLDAATLGNIASAAIAKAAIDAAGKKPQ
jgi:hypothetical protein